MNRKQIGVVAGLAALGLGLSNAHAGPMGSELDLGMMPASGGMEGVGIARPQDNGSMIFGNPATLTQLKGMTSFTLGGSYVSPSLKANGTFAVPNPAGPTTLPPVLAPINGKSKINDLAMPNAAVIQRLSPNMVAAMGLTGLSGLGSDWRNVLPASFSLVADLKLFGMGMSVAYKISENISIGGTFLLGIGSLQVGTVPSTAAVNNFGLGGIVGMSYDAGMFVLGTSYKSEVRIKYNNVLTTRNILDPTITEPFSDFTLTQPREIMIGVATSEKFMPSTLFEVDFRWKNYSKAAGYSSFWRNQWKIAFGAQQKLNEMLTVRAGYSYSRAIAVPADQLGFTFGSASQLFAPGFPGQLFGTEENVAPVTPGLIQLVQATIADGHWQQGISVGMGIQIMPQLRLDVNASFSYDGKITLVDPSGSGQSIDVNGKLLAAGMGMTWTFN